MIDGFTIALLTAEFGQVWAEYMCHDVTPQLWGRSEGKRSIQGIAVTSRRFHALVPSDNANVEPKLKNVYYSIQNMPQLWHDVTPQLRLI